MGYTINEPSDYKRIRELGNRLSKGIANRRMPAAGDISAVLGEGAVMPYYFMHALMMLVDNRRDEIAIQRHSFDAAFKPYFRLYDHDMPSNYLLTPGEIRSILVHDLGEDYGRNVVGAMVLNQLIEHLFGAQVGSDADLLTNKNALILKSLETKFIRHQNVAPYVIIDSAKDDQETLKISMEDIERQYKRIFYALRSFKKNDISLNYLAKPEQNELIVIVNNLLKSADEHKRSGVLRPSELEEDVKSQYAEFIGIVEGGNYEEVNPKLVPPEKMFLFQLKSTIYRDFIQRIAKEVTIERKIGDLMPRTGEYSFESPFIEKLAESTDNVANMDRIPVGNAVSIHTKARILLESGIALVDDSQMYNAYDPRLQLAVEWLSKYLINKQKYNHQASQGDIIFESNSESGVEKFEIMIREARDLEQRIRKLRKVDKFSLTGASI